MFHGLRSLQGGTATSASLGWRWRGNVPDAHISIPRVGVAGDVLDGPISIPRVGVAGNVPNGHINIPRLGVAGDVPNAHISIPRVKVVSARAEASNGPHFTRCISPSSKSTGG